MRKYCFLIAFFSALIFACSAPAPSMTPEVFDAMVLRHLDSAQAYNKSVSTALSAKDSSALWDYTERISVLAGQLSDSLSLFPFIDPSGYVLAVGDFVYYLFFLSEQLLPQYDDLFIAEPEIEKVREIILKNDSLQNGWESTIEQIEASRKEFIKQDKWELRGDN
jgi:hypothetical protein